MLLFFSSTVNILKSFPLCNPDTSGFHTLARYFELFLRIYCAEPFKDVVSGPPAGRINDIHHCSTSARKGFDMIKCFLSHSSKDKKSYVDVVAGY